MRKLALFGLVALVLALVLFSCAKKEEEEVKPKEMMPNPAAELAKSVENGKKLFHDVNLGTSGTSCSSCHAEGGVRDGKTGDMDIPAFSGLATKYPKYFGSAEKVMTLSQVNNFCLVMAMKGEPLAADDQRLADLTAYVASVKGVSEIEKKVDPEMEKVALEALAKSVDSGKKLFGDKTLGTTETTCNSCHVEGGTKEGTMGKVVVLAFNSVAARYPRFFPMAKKVVTLSQVNNFCIVNPLKGEALKWDDQKLADLSAYVASVKPAAAAE
jgi:cytochrome c